MMMTPVCFQCVSPVSSCQSIHAPADYLKSYGCSYNVLWVRSWLTKHPGKRRYVFQSKLHNYIITFSKLEAVWLCHSQGGRLFSGRKFTEVSVGKEHKHLVTKFFVGDFSDRHAPALPAYQFTLVHYRSASDTTSGAISAPEWNVNPRRLWDFHTKESAEDPRRIPALKGQSEWGYWPATQCDKPGEKHDMLIFKRTR